MAKFAQCGTLYGTCLVEDCVGKETPFDGIKLFTPPRDDELLYKWKLTLGLPLNLVIKKSARVCSRHFNPIDVQGMRLRPGALPVMKSDNTDDYEAYEVLDEYELEIGRNCRKGGRCCINGCFSQEDEKLKLHSFPQDRNRRIHWMLLCHINAEDINKKLYICEKHFSDQYFGKKKLLLGAVPDRNLPDENRS